MRCISCMADHWLTKPDTNLEICELNSILLILEDLMLSLEMCSEAVSVENK